MAERPLSKQRPYLLRAMHEWMTDNALTPHIVVDASYPGLDLPREHVSDNRIVLNASYAATRALVIGNDAVSFEARFNGVPRSLHVPVDAILGIYARENGQGMVFAEGPEPEPPGPDDDGPREDKRPSLRVVK
jgi:stringent starvation protein B